MNPFQTGPLVANLFLSSGSPMSCCALQARKPAQKFDLVKVLAARAGQTPGALSRPTFGLLPTLVSDNWRPSFFSPGLPPWTLPAAEIQGSVEAGAEGTAGALGQHTAWASPRSEAK